MVKMTKSKTFQAYLPNCHRTYSCVHCRAHLANHDELISKASVCSRNQGPMRSMDSPRCADLERLQPRGRAVGSRVSVCGCAVGLAVALPSGGSRGLVAGFAHTPSTCANRGLGCGPLGFQGQELVPG